MCKRCQDGDVNGERQARCWQQPLVTVSVKMLIQIQHKHKYKCWGKAVGVVAWERCIGGDRKPLTRKLRWKELLAKPYNAVELWALPKNLIGMENKFTKMKVRTLSDQKHFVKSLKQHSVSCWLSPETSLRKSILLSLMFEANQVFFFSKYNQFHQ